MYPQIFNYHLPRPKIAIYPPKIRGASKLMIVDRSHQKISHDRYANLYKYLKPNHLVVLNDTKVINARVKCVSDSKAHLELFFQPFDPQQNPNRARAIFHGRLKPGRKVLIGNIWVTVEHIDSNGVALIHSPVPLSTLLAQHGSIPIPPYLKRPANKQDQKRYQTAFARNPGSVAAPTASLNLTTGHLQQISQRAQVCYLNLNIGFGTFTPIRTSNPQKHPIHSESYHISAKNFKLIKHARNQNQPIIAVGTTVARALEHVGSHPHFFKNKSLHALADNYIYPPYKFKLIQGLLTNFHAPRTTLLLLVASFAGWDLITQAYQLALDRDYRFLSYGDSMLII